MEPTKRLGSAEAQSAFADFAGGMGMGIMGPERKALLGRASRLAVSAVAGGNSPHANVPTPAAG